VRVQEVLKQAQYAPVPLADQVMIFFAVTNGYLDDVDLRKVKDFEQAFLRYMADSHPELVQTVAMGAKLSNETQEALGQAIRDFKRTQAY
jgi:F-type H+-transporting ATPase subunit alpha